MWVEFAVRRDRWPTHRAVTAGRRGQWLRRGPWVMVLLGALVAGLDVFQLPATEMSAPERAEADADPAMTRHVAFAPDGEAIDRSAAGPADGMWTAAGCLVAGEAGHGTPEQAELRHLTETLARTATGAALLRQAMERRVEICLDRDTSLLAYYFANTNVIGIRSNLSAGQRMVFLAHELAHIPQHPRYSDNRFFPPQDLVLLRRMREAAAEATATRIAWELFQAGFPAAWQEKLNTAYADVARAFEDTVTLAQKGDAALLAATRAAFDQWFVAHWRRDVYDRMTVAHLQRISADAMGLVPARRAVTQAFLQPIGLHDDGNFLDGSGDRRLTDAYYAGRMSGHIAEQIDRYQRHAGTTGQSIEADMPADAAAGGTGLRAPR